MSIGPTQRVAAAAAAGAVTQRSRTALVPALSPLDPTARHPGAAWRARLVGDPARWERTNHRGEPVSLLEGPAIAAGLLAGGVLGAPSARAAVGTVVATAGAAAFGLVDDLTEDAASSRKGLRGHLGALAHGELTTGGLKVLGIGAAGVVAAAILTPVRPAAGVRMAPTLWAIDVVTSGALIAATANLLNLLDLRPGRALKAAGLAAAPVALSGGAGAGVASAVVGAAAGAARADLAEQDMLGDGGANALGALLGCAVVLSAPRPARLGALACAVGLTVLSERVSFSRVIARTPGLRELDALGRRAGERTA